MRVRDLGLVAAGLLAVAVGGCGAGANTTRTHGPGGAPPASPPTVLVTGQVTRICPGPLIAGRPRRCSERAVFERSGTRVVVTGRFSVRLRPGRYRVSVDDCANQESLDVKRAMAGLKLVPRCLQPL